MLLCSHGAWCRARPGDPAQDSSRWANGTENLPSNINKLKGPSRLKVASFAVKSRSHL